MTPTQRKWVRAAILAMFVSVGGLLATSPTSYRVNFDALLDIWGDVIRDVDAVVHTVHISTEMEIEIGDDIAKNLKKLMKLNEKALESVMEHNPEKVTQLMKDNKDLIKAFEKKDLTKIINIQNKYADYNNK